jgi:hypothetical protein
MGKRTLVVDDLILYGAGALALWFIIKGPGGFARDIAAGAVDTVTGAVTGAVGAVGEAVGLPGPSDTTQDPRVARWIIDSPFGGQALASAWSSVSAYVQAQFLPSGSGVEPEPGTKLAARFYVT